MATDEVTREAFERALQRAVRRLTDIHGEPFHGKVELHCGDGRLRRYTINATHKPRSGEVTLMEDA